MTAHVFVSGFVQGVGYRQFVRQNARRLGLTGWVKNLPARHASQIAGVAGRPDNRVEAVFQGSKEKTEEMIELCRKGPFLSEVENVEVEWAETEETFSDFKVIS